MLTPRHLASRRPPISHHPSSMSRAPCRRRRRRRRRSGPCSRDIRSRNELAHNEDAQQAFLSPLQPLLKVPVALVSPLLFNISPLLFMRSIPWPWPLPRAGCARRPGQILWTGYCRRRHCIVFFWAKPGGSLRRLEYVPNVNGS